MDDKTDTFAKNPNALLMLDAHCVKNPKKCLKTRQLMSQDGQIVTDLVWSPDSQYIAYLQSDDPLGVTTNLGDVWVVDVQSGQAQQLTEGKTSGSFSWSPDSSAVVYENITDSSLDVYIAFLDGRHKPGPVLTGFRASATPYWAFQ